MEDSVQVKVNTKDNMNQETEEPEDTGPPHIEKSKKQETKTPSQKAT